jgi:hypothetical protein
MICRASDGDQLAGTFVEKSDLDLAVFETWHC